MDGVLWALNDWGRVRVLRGRLESMPCEKADQNPWREHFSVTTYSRIVPAWFRGQRVCMQECLVEWQAAHTDMGDTEERERHLVSWLAGCARGEPAALENLYRALSPQLFGLLMRILKRRDLAEEALQDTFVNVWRKASEYRAGRGKVATWVLTIARNRAFDLLRRYRREVSMEPENLIGLGDALSVNDDTGDMRSMAEYRRLRQCMEALSEDQRSSLLLAYFEGLTQEEIAQRLEKPLGTVKSWVRRALISLKGCLGS